MTQQPRWSYDGFDSRRGHSKTAEETAVPKNHPQRCSVAPTVPEIAQCPGCPPGNSLPLGRGEELCGTHLEDMYAASGAYLNLAD
jgi:hypothetical protein